MSTLTAEVTKEIKDLTQEILKTGMYKSQSEIVRDAIRQLALKYGVKGSTIKNVRRSLSTAGAKSGKTLSRTIREIRDES